MAGVMVDVMCGLRETDLEFGARWAPPDRRGAGEGEIWDSLAPCLQPLLLRMCYVCVCDLVVPLGNPRYTHPPPSATICVTCLSLRAIAWLIVEHGRIAAGAFWKTALLERGSL